MARIYLTKKIPTKASVTGLIHQRPATRFKMQLTCYRDEIWEMEPDCKQRYSEEEDH